MKHTISAILLLAPVLAHSEPSTLFGQGNMACSDWDQDGFHGLFTAVWVQGYWSGLTLHPGFEKVGKEKLGPEGIIAVVKATCQNSPEETIATATVRAFSAAKQLGQ